MKDRDLNVCWADNSSDSRCTYKVNEHNYFIAEGDASMKSTGLQAANERSCRGHVILLLGEPQSN